MSSEEYSATIKILREKEKEYRTQKQQEKGFQLLRPYLSLAELENDVDALGDYSDPVEFQKYLAILFRLMAYTSSCCYKIKDVKIQGKSGDFFGHYSSEVMEAACHICSKKFPGEDIYMASDYSTSLYPKGEGLLSSYGVRAIGSAVAGPLGLNTMAEKSNFIEQWETENPCYMTYDITWEELEALEQEATLYLQNLNESKKQI